MVRHALALCAALVFLVGCAPSTTGNGYSDTSADLEKLAVRWDGAARSEAWTSAALRSLDAYGAGLVEMVPADIEASCPSYASLDEAGRKAFWTNLVASLAYHESTWQPGVAGGGGQWIGLLQIAPATARGYGCVARDAEALRNGAANVSCGIRIMSRTVGRDGVISEGRRGIAADWGPFQQANKRADIHNYTRALPYCRA